MNRLLVLFGLAALGIVELLGFGAFTPAYADASVASVAMGGIRFRKEARISMERERLWISTDQVRVEYEFVNQTNADIIVDLAFPMADAVCHPWKSVGPDSEVYNPDFQLWVEGTPQKYKTETQALAGKRVYTALLGKLGIDIATCGHYQEGRTSDFSKLSKQDLRRLSARGLVSPDGQVPLWTVRQVYYWTQTFPAGRTLHIKHVYKPGVGQSEQIVVNSLVSDWLDREACLDPIVGRKLALDIAGPAFEDASGYIYAWVDYTLKTGNNWQGPIKDFELNVEAPKDNGRWWVNFCWKGPIERLGPGHVRVKASNLSPAQNLHILFLPD